MVFLCRPTLGLAHGVSATKITKQVKETSEKKEWDQRKRKLN
jgi:hypothetical protein